MSEISELVFNIVMVVVTLWIVNSFWSSFYMKKDRNALSITIWIMLAAYLFYFESNRGNLRIGGTVIIAVLILFTAMFGFHSKGKSKYFLIIIFVTMQTLIEMIVFFMINDMDLERNKINTMGAVICKMIMIVVAYIIPSLLNNKGNTAISNKYHIQLLLLPIGSMSLAVIGFYSFSNVYLSMFTTSILLLFNIIVFDIYVKLDKAFAYESAKTVYTQQIEIISKSTEEQKKMMEEFHQEKHNLVNELIVLKGGIEGNDRESVIHNLNILINRNKNSDNISNSGNDTIDALINYKYNVAKEYGIDFMLKIYIPEELPIEQCDLGVVLGNTLDNAIEATKDCKDNKKMIEIFMGIKKEAWVMLIRNPYEHRLVEDRAGNLISTKQDNKRHGFGLKSVKRIVESYNGEVLTDITTNMFSVIAVMNLRQI